MSKKVKKGTETTISCVITGLSDATATVTWRTSTGDKVSGAEFLPNSGDQEEGKQTATLKVGGSLVTSDQAYTCTIESGSYSASGSSDTVVNLDIYGEITDYTIEVLNIQDRILHHKAISYS